MLTVCECFKQPGLLKGLSPYRNIKLENKKNSTCLTKKHLTELCNLSQAE